MRHDRDGTRKAALLVAALDPKAADLVLGRMEPKQAELVRKEASGLRDTDPREQRLVIDEFFRIGPLVPAREPPGIELDGPPARKPATRPQQAAQGPAPAASGPAFGFLREAETERLCRALGAERPQTVALVLSHLPFEQAGGVLVRLAPPLQAEVIRRLVDLEETAPEILREVEDALQSKLSQQVFVQRRRVAGLAAVAGILKAAGPQTGAQILDNLAGHDQALAERLSPRRIEFLDLAAMDDASLRAVFATADFELAVLALTGAAPGLADHVAGLLPPADARVLRARLENPGPTRLRDVEEARRRLGAHASRLAVEGRIAAPHAQSESLASLVA